MAGYREAGIKVLLVESSLGDARLLRRMLEWAPRDLRIEVRHCLDVASCCEALEEEWGDIILLDLDVPESQGLDTFRGVSRRAPGIPIVILTGMDDESLAIAALKEGAEDYLSKSRLDSRMLVRTIRYALERYELRRQTEFLATHDSLTMLYNRHYFNETIEKEIARSSRYNHAIGFLMIDVNGLKTINDAHGHQAGDEALRCVARFLREQLRTVDIVIRYGGDEFLAILPETDQAVETVAERLCAAKLECVWSGKTLDPPVTLSVGFSVWTPESGTSIDAILAAADAKLYESKPSRRSTDSA